MFIVNQSRNITVNMRNTIEIEEEYMRNADYWYIGYICEILDDSKLHYHHCDTWFRLFPNSSAEYSIGGIKNDNGENEVVVYRSKGEKIQPVFQGSLDGFKEWLSKSFEQMVVEEEGFKYMPDDYE